MINFKSSSSKSLLLHGLMMLSACFIIVLFANYIQRDASFLIGYFAGSWIVIALITFAIFYAFKAKQYAGIASFIFACLFFYNEYSVEYYIVKDNKEIGEALRGMQSATDMAQRLGNIEGNELADIMLVHAVASAELEDVFLQLISTEESNPIGELFAIEQEEFKSRYEDYENKLMAEINQMKSKLLDIEALNEETEDRVAITYGEDFAASFVVGLERGTLSTQILYHKYFDLIDSRQLAYSKLIVARDAVSSLPIASEKEYEHISILLKESIAFENQITEHLNSGFGAAINTMNNNIENLAGQ